MKFNFQWILFFIGTLLLTMSIVGGNSLDKQELNRLIGIDQTVIRVKGSPANDEIFFNLKDMESLYDQKITFTALLTTEIDSKLVCVIGTNSEYSDFEHLQFSSGCFFDKTAEASADKVVIIDEHLAWNVFGNLNAVGNTLEIFNRKFRVVGVTASEKSIVGLLSGSGTANAFIPYSTLLEVQKNGRINSVQIRNNDTGLTGQNHTDALNVLGKLGKNPDDYYISDFNIKGALIAQKPRILAFAAGLAVIIVLFRFFMRRGQEVYIYVSKECKTDYFNNVLKDNKAILLQNLFIILSLILAMALFGMNIRFDIYIPPEYLPKQLIDLEFYLDLIKKGVSESYLNQGYMAPVAEIRSGSVLLLSNCLFYTGLLIGFPLVWISLELSNWDDGIPLWYTLFVLGCTYIGSIGLCTVTLLLSGISPNLNIKDLAIVFSFIYIYAIQYSVEEKKGERCEK